MQKIILLFFIVLTANSAFSQFVYHKTFGGDSKDVVYSSCPSSEGGVVLLGLTSSFGNSKEVIVMNVAPDGNVLWSKVYGGQKADIASKIKPTTDGGYIIVGTTASFKVTRKDVYLFKIDASGSVQWSKTYGGKYIEYGFDVEQCSDGGYIVVGETNSFEAEDHDLLTIKVDSQGELQWGHIYGDRHIEFGQAVHETEEGYVIAGETDSYSHDTTGSRSDGVNDIFLLKIDFDGEVIWSYLYGGNDDDFITDMILDVDYGIFLLGNTFSYGMGGRDGLMIRTNNEGEVIQAKTMGNEGDEQLQTVNRVGDDGYIITGMSNSHNDEIKKEDALLIRLTAKGNFRWSKTFGGEENDMGLSAYVNDQKHILMAGGTDSFNKLTDQDIYVLKLQDERKMDNCELSTVQVVSVPLKTEEIHADAVGLHHKPVTPTVSIVETVVRDIELQETTLCESDVLLIGDDNKKKKANKTEELK